MQSPCSRITGLTQTALLLRTNSNHHPDTTAKGTTTHNPCAKPNIEQDAHRQSCLKRAKDTPEGSGGCGNVASVTQKGSGRCAGRRNSRAAAATPHRPSNSNVRGRAHGHVHDDLHALVTRIRCQMRGVSQSMHACMHLCVPACMHDAARACSKECRYHAGNDDYTRACGGAWLGTQDGQHHSAQEQV
jgi:hypothetical protein